MSKQSEHLFDAITNADDSMVEKAQLKKRPRWRAVTALAACLALIIGIAVWHPWNGGGSIDVVNVSAPTALAKPVYPVMAAYPADGNGDFMAWHADIEKQTDQPEGYADGLNDYFTRSIQTFLADSGSENVACSPVNIYMALAMLAETTDGTSRQQILDLLGADSIDALRAQASSVWNANYRDDGLTKSVLASSLWLRDGEAYHQQTADTLAQNYYASVFRGEMGSDAYNELLQSWLNEQTGGLLGDQAAQAQMDADSVMALATTIYYQAKWSPEFAPSNTEQSVFHGAKGDETADFMYQEFFLPYYRGTHFQAVAVRLQSDGCMWFLLPDEGVTPEDLLQDAEAAAFLVKPQVVSDESTYVYLSLPKFDTASGYSLLDGLKALGVTDVCDAEKADFSPLISGPDGMYLTNADHAVRVAIDEEGVTAAAFTMMVDGLGAPDPDLEIHLKVDRPFLYTITGHADVPLFTGIVNSVG